MSGNQARTVVITGASAGVGRATALAFARHGWKLALVARDPPGLQETKEEVERAGGSALTIPADVSDAEAMFAVSDRVVKDFGTIDVWVNNAMVTMFSPVGDMTPAEYRRITEVTYLGYVYGTMAALRHMRVRNAGTIVQVGSALAYRAIPLQSAYCGAKFAIRGFTDALRSELQHEKSAVRITMVQLPAVNTPQFDWGRNKMPRRPQPVGPIHQPEAVAETIFRASHHAPRELWVGFASVKAILGTMVMPGMLDRLLARKGYDGQLSSEPRQPDGADNLFQPVSGRHAAHGRFDDRAQSSVMAFQPPILRAAVVISGLLFALALGFVITWLLG
jgi:short-subunit dehydrogenase